LAKGDNGVAITHDIQHAGLGAVPKKFGKKKYKLKDYLGS
jgi:hypothetical protein